jgi:hypothetical protein
VSLLIAHAAEIGKSWPELPATRQRALLTALIERIDVRANRIDIHFRPTRLGALLYVAATPLPSATEEEIQILSVPIEKPRFSAAVRAGTSGLGPTRAREVSFVEGFGRRQ